jgi:hypothetical protein
MPQFQPFVGRGRRARRAKRRAGKTTRKKTRKKTRKRNPCAKLIEPGKYFFEFNRSIHRGSIFTSSTDTSTKTSL